METVNAPIVLLHPTMAKNGLIAMPDKHNPKMLNISKCTIAYKGNRLVMRYNTTTGQLMQDGSTWRNYKPSPQYDNDWPDVLNALNKLYK